MKTTTPGMAIEGRSLGDGLGASASGTTVTAMPSWLASESRCPSVGVSTSRVSRGRGGFPQGSRSSGSRMSGTGKADSAKNSATDCGSLSITMASGPGDAGHLAWRIWRQAAVIPASWSADQRRP